ncbi:hypothetical protein Tco_0295323 [Tanacetum coccineum]
MKQIIHSIVSGALLVRVRKYGDRRLLPHRCGSSVVGSVSEVSGGGGVGVGIGGGVGVGIGGGVGVGIGGGVGVGIGGGVGVGIGGGVGVGIGGGVGVGIGGGVVYDMVVVLCRDSCGVGVGEIEKMGGLRWSPQHIFVSLH